MKTCSRCKQEKAVTQFNRKTRAHDGLQSYCRDCQHGSWSELYPPDIRFQRNTNQRNAVRETLEDIAALSCAHCGAQISVVIPEDYKRNALSKKLAPDRIISDMIQLAPRCSCQQ